VPGHLTRGRLIAAAVLVAAVLPYLPTLDDYFVQDDFGVVSLLSGKPAGAFPRWFVSTWMDDIWGFTPDEVRPFPAVTYQLAALWGAASPVANHVINIAFHAANALLVLAAARTAAGLGDAGALVAALAFALLPMQSESVAWITGRVDSMPACFYAAAFLLYARWRATGRRASYAWSVVFCFVALFTKQNTVTLAPALVFYDLVVERRAPRASWRWMRPYVPFVLLTAGYLALRYVLFGEIARERTLTADRLTWFLQDLSVHLRRMAFGEFGLQVPMPRAAAQAVAAAAAVAAIGLWLARRAAAPLVRPAIYFALVWIGLGIAPTVVAGYASPRHMYLASIGWAITLGLGFEVVWRARPARVMRPAASVLAAAVLAAYAGQLAVEIRTWRTRAEVSRLAVADIEREAMAAARGTLLIAGAPQRSWNFALPHALRPPFTASDLTARVSVVSHSSLHCCPAPLWEAHTRGALRTWIAHPERPPVVALHWDPESGALSRLTEQDDPILRPLMTELLETGDVAALDRAIEDTLTKLVAGRGVRKPQNTPRR
jgi:hypothetical protein